MAWSGAAGLGAAAHAEDLTLDQVVERYYQAMGGEEAWSKVTAMHQKGVMQMMGMEAPMEIWSKRPRRLRIEFTMQGMTGIQAVDGDSGWQVMPFMGSTEPEPMPDDMLKAMSSDVDVDGPLFDWQEKGHQVELVGKEDVEGTEAYRLDLVLKGGTEITLFLDAEHFVPIRLESKASFQGQEFESTTTISDYKEVDGLMVAHSLQAETPMGAQTITVQEVEVNPEIEDSFFAMPAPAATPADPAAAPQAPPER
jgi:outer membrane lipoprotein-sorting protein